MFLTRKMENFLNTASINEPKTVCVDGKEDDCVKLNWRTSFLWYKIYIRQHNERPTQGKAWNQS